MKTAQDFIAFGQGNVEAFMKSGQILAAGMQDLSKQMAAAAQASVDEAMAAFKTLAGTRSVKEAMDVQAALARSIVEKTIAGTSGAAEASYKLAEQAAAPIAGRVNLAVDSFKAA